MNRRTFLSGLMVGTLTAPLAAEAQQKKVDRVGVLFQGARPSVITPGTFDKALHDLGYTEGRNLVIERRWAEGKEERFAGLAVELVALKPDAIVAETTPGVMAVMRATATIPIVMVNVADPVGSGLVASLARPGRNVTGGSNSERELVVKLVELVQAAVPKATRIAVLMSNNPTHPSMLKDIQDAAKGTGLTVLPTTVRSSDDFENAFRSMAKQKAGALIVLGGAPFSGQLNVAKINALAVQTKLPTVYPTRGFVETGGLLSYGQSAVHKWRLAATYVDKILKGAKPSDLPVQQPTEFELVINLKTAKALGLTIPPSLLGRADHVID